jgi:hypothetical protein
MPDIVIKKIESSFEWEAPEYEHHERSNDWYWAMGIFAVALIVVAFLFKSVLFGLLVMLGGFSLGLYSVRKPTMVSFNIGPRGVGIGDRVYFFEDLKSFWVRYDPPHVKELVIESKKAVMPHITIPLADSDPVAVRTYLLRFLPEEKIDESLIVTVGRLLKL